MHRVRRWVRHSSIILLALGFSTSRAPAQQSRDVFVVNLPETQHIAGTVSVAGPTPQTELVRFAELVVSPVQPTETTALVHAGTLVAEGFVSVVLSLAGQIKADIYSPGEVGAILVPDEEPVLTAFLEEGQILLPLKAAAATARGGGAWFNSKQEALRLAFPRYRVYFYNTTDRPASVTLFAYLANSGG